jgi:protease I
MVGRLDGKRVAILVTEGFEESEMVEPRDALKQEGAETVLISPKPDRVKSWTQGNWGSDFPVDQPLQEADPDDFDALMLPGGVRNPDRLRLEDSAVKFVRAFFDAGKPVAAICHAPWLLVEADVLRGRTVTSFPSLKTDLRNAGANWVDEEVVVDAGLVSSRTPADLPAFNAKLVEEIAEGEHEGQTA